ncbi:MAG TPA: ExeM/NucH family extracellular endonuclease [Gammaproteobacteria bacterium]|nr:ExeM/NucH family extracellular endonuclease [Gammaproteobacteria bacterium]
MLMLLAVLGPARFASGECGTQAMPLHALATARPGRTVRVAGVVTAVFPGMHGFFLEAPHARWDSDPGTSEAMFVYGGRHVPKGMIPGQRLAFSARFQHFHGLPELAYPRRIEHCGRHALPPAITVSLPHSARQWKSVLGMRIQLAQALTVDDLADWLRYGAVRVHAGGRHYAPTALTAPGPQIRRLEKRSPGREIWLDVRVTGEYPRKLQLGNETFNVLHPLRVGDIFKSVGGVAYHAYGHDVLEVTHIGRADRANPRPAWASLKLPRGLRIVTFNVENYFNRASSGPLFPTERGARTRSQWQCQTNKLVAALKAMQPAVAGLEEVENNGYGPDGALAALVKALNRALPDGDYRFIRPGVRRLGTDLIAPALIYDADRVRTVGHVAVLQPPGDDRAVRTGFTRPALAASFRSRAGGKAFTVVVAHLRSKRSACGMGLDDENGGGHCARARARAVAYLERWIGKQPTDIATSAVALAGDFNAYPHAVAIRELLQGGWQVEPPLKSGEPEYTENASQGSGRLDYIFLSAMLAKRVRAAAIWHIDADEARGLDYAGRPACHGPAAPYRASDHDPVIAVLELP